MAETPHVRVVVLNYNGGDRVTHALERLSELDWPRDRLETVVVDNASSDGSAEQVRTRFPGVRVIDAGANLGFAGGNNLGLRDLAGADFVALLNNDAYVEPGWLSALVAVLQDDPALGAACPKILFAPRFVELTIASPTFVPGRGDPRSLGVRVSGVRVDGVDTLRETHFADGFYGEERGPGEELVFHWTGPAGTLRVPAGERAAIRLAAEREKAINVSGAAIRVESTPGWVDVPLDGSHVDVIQNAGSQLVAGGYAGDRGFLEVDRGQYDRPTDVFAWCGCSVLLRPRYLADVGLLDERLFLYYEDTDLSWRGQSRGWRYRYVPEAIVRHVHTATSIEGSELFQYYVERNRLLVHVKNAPAGYALRAIGDWAWPTLRFAVRDAISPLLHGRRPHVGLLRRRARAFVGFLRLAPAVLAERPRARGDGALDRRELRRWVVDR